MNLSSSGSPVSDSASYTFVLQNRLSDLIKLNDWLKELAERLALSARDTFRIDLALTEAVTNVIKHAYRDEAEHSITITLRHLDRTVSIELIDDGQPFDPLQQPEVVLPRTLEEAEEGGLGIHLIRSYTDELHYRRQAGKNILTMKFTVQRL